MPQASNTKSAPTAATDDRETFTDRMVELTTGINLLVDLSADISAVGREFNAIRPEATEASR